MNVIENVIQTCEKQTLCQKCCFYNHNTGVCIFHGKPDTWEAPTVNMYLKLDEPETPKRKKRGE